MAVNRAFYNRTFGKDLDVGWTCPTCSRGLLVLLDGAFAQSKDSTSENEMREEWFDAEDHYRSRFSAILKCSYCRDSVVVSGYTGVVREWPTGDFSDEFYRVTYVCPSPRLIDIPKTCPYEIQERMDRAFVSCWDDFSAAANHVRSAVELILDGLGVPCEGPTGKPIYLALRIKTLEQTDNVLFQMLNAIRFIGNAGSHDVVDRRALFDAFDVIDAVFRQLYCDVQSNALAIATRINELKGPRRGRNNVVQLVAADDGGSDGAAQG